MTMFPTSYWVISSVDIQVKYYSYIQTVDAIAGMFVFSQLLQYSYVENLMSIFSGGAFERSLGHENGTFLNGMCTFIRESPERSLVSSTMWG